MAALPAAISVMETLNNEAKGYAFLEVTNEEDKQTLNIPKGIEVNWLIHPNPKNKSEQQLDAIKKVEKLEGQPNVFVLLENWFTRRGTQNGKKNGLELKRTSIEF